MGNSDNGNSNKYVVCKVYSECKQALEVSLLTLFLASNESKAKEVNLLSY